MIVPILRLAYVVEFLIALIAVFTVWSQVGGQGHLDLMPWYWKLLLGCGAAFAIVKATQCATLGGERAWNRGTRGWLICLLLLLLGMAWATYYIHAHEPSEEQEGIDIALKKIGPRIPPKERIRRPRSEKTKFVVLGSYVGLGAPNSAATLDSGFHSHSLFLPFCLSTYGFHLKRRQCEYQCSVRAAPDRAITVKSFKNFYLRRPRQVLSVSRARSDHGESLTETLQV